MFLSIEALGLLIGAIGLFYVYLTWDFNYWKKRGIPSDKPKVLFGSLKDSCLVKRTMGEILTDIYRAFPDEKVVGWFNLGKPALMIRDPEIIHRVIVPDFSSFHNNDVEIDENADPILGRNIFVQKDELWKKNRALITPAFTAGKIKAIFPQMVVVAQEFAEYLKKHPEELHVKHMMSRYTTEITARCAFGIEGNCFKDSKPLMHEMGKQIFEPTGAFKQLKMMAFFVVPRIMKLLKVKIVPDEVVHFFDSILKDVIVYRQKNDVQRNDLVQYLIEVKRKTIEVEKGNIQSDIVTRTYTDDDVLSGCVMFFVESFETSSLLLSHVLYKLALHRDVQEKLRAEIDKVMKKGELTFETVNDMNYLNCVLLETNRVLPSGYHLQKRCTEDYEMNIGKDKPLKIEKGTTVVLPIYALHTDPKYWENVDLFKPERFANKEDISARAKGVYLPFGDGPRMCIGVRIASTVMKVAIIHILSKFVVLPTSKTPKQIDQDPTYFGLDHKGGLYLKFAERGAAQ